MHTRFPSSKNISTRTISSRFCKQYDTYARSQLLAIVCALKNFRTYVYGRDVTVFTDHKPLKEIIRTKDPTSRII